MDITKSDIERALSSNAFELYYQPKVNFLTGNISSAEALVRWKDPQKGSIPPDIFIPLAEQTGLITEITAQLLPLAIRAVQDFNNDGFDISVAVNTSPLDFQSTQLLNILQKALDDKSIKPKNIQIELTETATLENKEHILGHLNDLSAMGFKLVMDDFGTGYSSIDLLGQLPFSALKVDQGVIGRMANSSKNLNIVNMVINMARTLRMNVVAEGIEDSNTYRFLAYAGCLEAQGYWISKPLALDDFRAFIAKKPQYPSTHLGLIYHAHMNTTYFRKAVLDALLYKRCGEAKDMQSVTIPDIEFDPEKTRMGQWYYGIGQELSDRDSFKAIEAPHRRMHNIGKQILEDNNSGTNDLVLEINNAFDAINNALCNLEAELIAEEQCKTWSNPL